MRRSRFNWLIDVAALSVTTVVGIVAVGRFLDSAPAHRLDDQPIVGDFIIGIRNAWGQVYDPSRLP